jgi:hypothetical protein
MLGTRCDVPYTLATQGPWEVFMNIIIWRWAQGRMQYDWQCVVLYPHLWGIYWLCLQNRNMTCAGREGSNWAIEAVDRSRPQNCSRSIPLFPFGPFSIQSSNGSLAALVLLSLPVSELQFFHMACHSTLKMDPADSSKTFLSACRTTVSYPRILPSYLWL